MGQVERAELCGAVVAGRYRLGRRLGIGGTSVVFEAEWTADGATVVVKVLREMFAFHAELWRRLRREAEVACAVAHPGIVPVLDEGILEDGSPFLGARAAARRVRRSHPASARAAAGRPRGGHHAAHRVHPPRRPRARLRAAGRPSELAKR